MIVRAMIFALALGAPAAALAEEMPVSPLGLEVRGDDGTVLSRVEGVQRDRDRRVVAIEAPGLEPADAPSDARVAEREAQHFFVSYPVAERNDRTRPAGGGIVRAR